jgi:hypothetical protein
MLREFMQHGHGLLLPTANGVLKFVIGFASRISKTENNARVPSARRPLLRHARMQAWQASF